MYCVNLDNGCEHINYLSTVSEQKNHFFDIDNKKTVLARYIQECRCLLSDINFADAIDKGGIKEYGVIRRHIKIANIIFGPVKAAIEGKTAQRKNKIPRDNSLITDIPPSIIERYKMVTLGIVVLHINKPPFIIAISKHIKHFQCMGNRNKNTATFFTVIQKMKYDYMIQGFVVKMIYADQVFESCKTKLSEQTITFYYCDTHFLLNYEVAECMIRSS